MVRTDDDALLLCATTCEGTEGQRGQHVITARSEDMGVTWSSPVAVEPPDGPEASYAVLLKVPGGRIYLFYNHNSDNVRSVPADDPEVYPDGQCYRVDSLGYFVFKYSDDHGRSWSRSHHRIPVREFQIDRENTSGGALRYFWNVGKAFYHQNRGFIPLHKVGSFGRDFFTRSEGALLMSPNIGSEKDPAKIIFKTLPEGDIGLRAPKGAGAIAEEQSFTPLSDGKTIFCVYRTVSGYAVCSYSDDLGHNWTQPDFLRYPDGRPVKNPRAANFCWPLSGNRYLYWFHNHSGKSYADRNPVWVLAGKEVSINGRLRLHWSQPEILLYTDDITRRMSYPDCIEWYNEVWISETEKENSRLHRIDPVFLQKLFSYLHEKPSVSREGLLVEENMQDKGDDRDWHIKAPWIPPFYDREGTWEMISGKDLHRGATIDLILRNVENLFPGKILCSNFTPEKRGFCIRVSDRGNMEIQVGDGRNVSVWEISQDLADSDKTHAITFVIDGGPKTISVLVNGVFFDGGNSRQFGFGLFYPFLVGINGEARIRLAREVQTIRIYDRALLSCEVVANHRASAESRPILHLSRSMGE